MEGRTSVETQQQQQLSEVITLPPPATTHMTLHSCQNASFTSTSSNTPSLLPLLLLAETKGYRNTQENVLKTKEGLSGRHRRRIRNDALSIFCCEKQTRTTNGPKKPTNKKKGKQKTTCVYVTKCPGHFRKTSTGSKSQSPASAALKLCGRKRPRHLKVEL